MGFLDNISKTISHGVDRAKFEADKFQKVSRIQGKLHELNKQLNDKMIELGQRAYDLHRAGHIQAPSIAGMAQTIDQLRAEIVMREEDLKAAQAETYVEPSPPAVPPSQPIPVSHDSVAQEAPAAPSTSATSTKPCPNCRFQMPMHSVFCPNCGLRVG